MAGRSNPMSLELARSAQDLHQLQFGEKQQMDAHKMSIDEQKQLLDSAKLLESATIARARLQNEYRKTITSAAAISAMSQLNPRDKDFEKKWGDTISKYAEGLDSKAAQDVMAQKRQDYQLFQKAEHERTAASFGDPVISAAYQKAFDQYKDPKLASIAAEATKQHIDLAKKLATSPHLSPEDKAQIYNPQTGDFSLDPTALRKLDIKNESAVAAQKNQMDQLKISKEASDAGVKVTPAAAPTAAVPEWKQLADRYLPGSAAPTPTPKATPAPSETPAATPTPTPTADKVAEGLPGGDELEAAENQE